MNKTQAMAALKRLLGKNAAWRYDDNAPRAEEREAIRASLPALSCAYAIAKTAMEDRRKELLHDPEYIQLVAECQKARDKHTYALSCFHSHRVILGRSDSLFFHIDAEGDNWQEAIDTLKAKLAKAVK